MGLYGSNKMRLDEVQLDSRRWVGWNPASFERGNNENFSRGIRIIVLDSMSFVERKNEGPNSSAREIGNEQP